MAHPALAFAARHVHDILTLAVEHAPVSAPALGPAAPGSEPKLAPESTPASVHKALVVFDARSELSRLLTEAYRLCLPDADFLDFDSVPQENVLAAFDRLGESDLAVLIQSVNFRLEAFRIRVGLFKRGIKVIEHPHLERMTGQEALWYVDALAYDAAYYRGTGAALKQRIDRARRAEVESGGETLVFASPLEEAKLNVGDYRGMKNVGGQFPIGEVFTEARDLEAVSGRLRIFVFAGIDFMLNRPERPIILVIERGRVTGAIDSTPGFERVLAGIRADEGEVWVRELGFGMNRAFAPHRMVRDIGTLERMCGIHLSLGAKHAVYQKPDFKRRDTRHHVDVFAVTNEVRLDGEVVFRDGAWTV